MAGLPLLNNALTVETLGFQVYGGRVVGVLITPWLMNLVLLPGQGDDWNGLELGHKQPHEFPSGNTSSWSTRSMASGAARHIPLFSPMREFVSQAHALAAAEAFLRDLMTPAVADSNEPVDEELLGRIMRGEERRDRYAGARRGRLVETGPAGTPPGRHRGAGRGYNGVTPRPPAGVLGGS